MCRIRDFQFFWNFLLIWIGWYIPVRGFYSVILMFFFTNGGYIQLGYWRSIELPIHSFNSSVTISERAKQMNVRLKSQLSIRRRGLIKKIHGSWHHLTQSIISCNIHLILYKFWGGILIRKFIWLLTDVIANLNYLPFTWNIDR